MPETNTIQELTGLLDLPDNHSIELMSSSKVERDSVVYETQWLNEHDDSRQLVARFRIWANRSLKPPYRKQRGWEKFSLNGALLDREVRYSKRDDMTYLH